MEALGVEAYEISKRECLPYELTLPADVQPPTILERRWPLRGSREDPFFGYSCLHLTIDESGNVRDITAVHTNHPRFSLGATRALKTWKFRPALRNGQPITVKVSVYIVFYEDWCERCKELERQREMINEQSGR